MRTPNVIRFVLPVFLALLAAGCVNAPSGATDSTLPPDPTVSRDPGSRPRQDRGHGVGLGRDRRRGRCGRCCRLSRTDTFDRQDRLVRSGRRQVDLPDRKLPDREYHQGLHGRAHSRSRRGRIDRAGGPSRRLCRRRGSGHDHRPPAEPHQRATRLRCLRRRPRRHHGPVERVSTGRGDRAGATPRRRVGARNTAELFEHQLPDPR